MGPEHHRRRPIIVWVPVGTNVVVVALAALLHDAVAVALTSVSAAVVTCAVVIHLRESDADKERIALLQSAVPHMSSSVDPEAVVNLVPRPSPVVGEVLRQHTTHDPRDAVSLGAATPISIPPTGPIDRS